MSLATRIPVLAAALLCAGCSSVYHMSNSSNGSELSQQQKSALLAKKSAVPCRVEVICPSDMVGRYETFFTDNTCHYPLEQVIEQSFSNAVYCAFEQPGGEVLDAFTLKVEVYKSELSMDSSDANYHICLNVTLDEPGEKKVVTFSIDKSAHIPSTGPQVVPDAVYDAIKNAAIDTMNKLKNDPKVVKTVKRFERK